MPPGIRVESVVQEQHRPAGYNFTRTSKRTDFVIDPVVSNSRGIAPPLALSHMMDCIEGFAKAKGIFTDSDRVRAGTLTLEHLQRSELLLIETNSKIKQLPTVARTVQFYTDASSWAQSLHEAWYGQPDLLDVAGTRGRFGSLPDFDTLFDLCENTSSASLNRSEGSRKRVTYYPILHTAIGHMFDLGLSTYAPHLDIIDV